MRAGDDERTGFRRRLRRAETEAERNLWRHLRDRRLCGFKFVRQESIGRYVADFCCREARVIVELDGSQHAESAHDRARDAWIVAQGYRILRFWNVDVMTNTQSVLDTILAGLPPSPRTRGEGRDGLVARAASPQGEGEGACPIEPRPASPPHPRLPPRSVDDEVDRALSSRAGRGGANP